MDNNAFVKRKFPEGSMTRRREAMETMIGAGKAMLKAHGNAGVLPLPEKYNLMAIQVQEFIEWRRSLVFKITPIDPKELI